MTQEDYLKTVEKTIFWIEKKITEMTMDMTDPELSADDYYYKSGYRAALDQIHDKLTK